MNKDLKKAGLSLFELGQSLGLAPPSHGYTIAEKAPEIVTAPGVYFPIKRGRVIPLKSRQFGGEVNPSLSDFGPKTDEVAKRAVNPNTDLMTSITGGIPLQPRAAGGVTDPSMTEEELKRFREAFPDTITGRPEPVVGAENLAANAPVAQTPVTQAVTEGQPASPAPAQNVGVMDPALKDFYQRRLEREFPENPSSRVEPVRGGGDLSAQAPTAKPPVQTLPVEAVKKEETVPLTPAGSLSDFKKETLPSGETKYTLPGTEGTATVGPERFFVQNKEVPTGTPGAISGDELARKRISADIATQRKEWEKELAPQKRTYYDAHPEERQYENMAAVAETANKPMVDTYMKLIEDARKRIQGFGLPMDSKEARETQAAAAASLPHLTQNLAALNANTQETAAKMFGAGPERGRRISPHWVQTETGEIVAISPPGTPGEKPTVSPTGVMGPKKGVPETRLQHVQEDKGDMYRKGTFNPASGENVWGEWQKKGATPSMDASVEKADLRGKMQLRQQFNNLQPVKDYRDIVTRHSAMQEAVNESKKTKNFVAVDQAIITLFNKMTDPQSVVRESEYARTPSDMGIVNRVKGKISKIMSGGAGLTDDERSALLSMAERFKSAYEKTYKGYEKEYRDYATMNKWNPDEVLKSTGERPSIGSFGENPRVGVPQGVSISKEEWISRARQDKRNDGNSDAVLSAEYDRKYGGK